METSLEKELTLAQKIRTRQVHAGIIGLGYVGLPLAVEFASSGIQVVGIDIDSRKVHDIRQGRSYIKTSVIRKFKSLFREDVWTPRSISMSSAISTR